MEAIKTKRFCHIFPSGCPMDPKGTTFMTPGLGGGLSSFYLWDSCIGIEFKKIIFSFVELQVNTEQVI